MRTETSSSTVAWCFGRELDVWIDRLESQTQLAGGWPSSSEKGVLRRRVTRFPQAFGLLDLSVVWCILSPQHSSGRASVSGDLTEAKYVEQAEQRCVRELQSVVSEAPEFRAWLELLMSKGRVVVLGGFVRDAIHNVVH